MNGVDISWYQKGLDLASLKSQGIDFAILKVGEGKTIVDSCFDTFYKAAKAAGIAVGAYFFSYATTVDWAVEDAKRALALVNGRDLPLGIYMDVEDPAQMKLRDSELTAVVKAFCDTIRAGGYRPGAYGSLGNLWAKVGPSYLGDDVLVWVAAWSNSAPRLGDVWQNTDNARFSGYNGPVDGDKSLSERFTNLVIGNAPAPAPTPEPTPIPDTGDTVTVKMPVLQFGSASDYVKLMQKLLTEFHGCWCGAWGSDGVFGNATKQALMKFQKQKGLDITGVCSSADWAQLLNVEVP